MFKLTSKAIDVFCPITNQLAEYSLVAIFELNFQFHFTAVAYASINVETKGVGDHRHIWGI